jgi:protein-S-isoprenylcysteine O-methyltransferase Ste14
MVFVILPLTTRPGLFWGSEVLDRVVVILGILIAFAGQSLRLLVIGYVYVKRGGKNRRIYADKLVVEGFYAHTRNPMYVGNFLITVGVGITYGSPWIYFLVIPFFSFVYVTIVMAEEAFLSDKFGGEYEDYVQRVNRFVPDFRGIKNSLKDFHYDWKRALRKDYGTIFGTLFGILIINLWKTYYLYGFQARKGAIVILAVLFIPLGLLYALVSYLKSSGRLASPN